MFDAAARQRTDESREILLLKKNDWQRDIAQPGRALALGARCRWFESVCPDQYKKIKTDTEKCPLFLYPLKAQF